MALYFIRELLISLKDGGLDQVYVALIACACDTPAARKVGGFPGTGARHPCTACWCLHNELHIYDTSEFEFVVYLMLFCCFSIYLNQSFRVDQERNTSVLPKRTRCFLINTRRGSSFQQGTRKINRVAIGIVSYYACLTGIRLQWL